MLSCLVVAGIAHRTHAATTALDDAAVRFVPKDLETPKPLFLYLHGMCDAAEDVCARYAPAVGERGFLVCPHANVACPGGGTTWKGEDRDKNVVPGIAATMLAHPNRVDTTTGGTIIGFSLGAAVALDLAVKHSGWWKGLVLIASMTVEPDVTALRAAGIERVVLAVGDLDMARPHMEKVAARLKKEGMPVRFVSLGKIGHWYPKDLAARMGPALAWAQTGDA